MKHEKWLKAKKDLQEAQNWFANKDKKHSQSGELYGFMVRINNEAFQYCGQARAGATNYHPAPKSLNAKLGAVIKRNFHKLYAEAIEEMAKEVVDSGKESKEELENMLAEVNATDE